MLNTAYLVNFNKQNSKKQVFKSKHEIHYLPLQIWSDYFQVRIWTAVEEAPNK